MNSWEIIFSAIATVIAIASFVYGWMNERHRRKAEASLVKVTLSCKYVKGYGDAPVINIAVANRHPFPIKMKSICLCPLIGKRHVFIGPENLFARDEAFKDLNPYEHIWVFMETEFCVKELVKLKLRPFVSRFRFIDLLMIDKFLQWQNAIRSRFQRKIRFRVMVRTSIIEDYKSNRLKVKTIHYRQDIRKIIKDRHNLIPYY
jgi:hypothetical protein